MRSESLPPVDSESKSPGDGFRSLSPGLVSRNCVGEVGKVGEPAYRDVKAPIAMIEPLRTPADFDRVLAGNQKAELRRRSVSTLQVNVGKLCNQACHHCHVDAGPKRTENMTRETADRIIELVAVSSAIETLDLTGGAPELNPNFEYLVLAIRELGRRVIDRCNLTVLFEPGMSGLLEFFTTNRVELVCSLPCYTAEIVDRQRGLGVFDKSIEALRMLTECGYGRPGSGLRLDLVYNPADDSLPPQQTKLEAEYREQLAENFGIRFDSLLTITNMPIKRFAEQLARSGRLDAYMALLVQHFNPATVDDLMCRDLVSVGWEGTLYDCDFNQMLESPILGDGRAVTIFDIDHFDEIADVTISTGPHCFGCTAGAGSGCSGAIKD